MNPKGWAKTTLGELVPLSYGKALAKGERREGPYPVFGSSGIVGDHAQALTSGPAIIVGRKGNVGQVYLSTGPCWPIDTVYFHQVLPHLDGRFLFYLLEQQALRRLDKSTAVPGLSRDDYNRVEASMPSVAEQARISEALESHLSRLDAAVASLERARAKLKAYRASVLKAAVEGRLVPTEAELARAENRDYEAADVLLKRILAERRRRWEEADIAKMNAARKTPKDERLKSKYVEPVVPDAGELQDLPEGWCWATVETVADLKGGITKGQRRPADTVLQEVPYLRVANVQRGYLDLREIKTIAATDDEIAQLRLEPGDVLFNEGGDRDKLGRGWVWGGEIQTCIHQNHVFRARLFTTDLQPRFLSIYANSSGQRYFFDEGKQTTNLASINMTKLRALPVPLPPLAEQDRILDEVERLISVESAVETAIRNERNRCARLRQSILKWAFEGKLVDQVSNDEPASTLLERIRVERTSATAVKKSQPRRKAKATR